MGIDRERPYRDSDLRSLRPRCPHAVVLLGVTSSTSRWRRSTMPTAAGSFSRRTSDRTRMSMSWISRVFTQTSSVSETSRRTSSAVSAIATATIPPVSGTGFATSAVTSSTSFSPSSMPVMRQGGNPARTAAQQSRLGATRRARRQVESAEVDPRRLLRVPRIQQRKVRTNRMPRGNQRVRSRNSVDGETTIGGRWLARRPRDRRFDG